MIDGYYDAVCTWWELTENNYGPVIKLVLLVDDKREETTLSLNEDEIPATGKRRWEQTLDVDMPYVGFTGGRDVTLLEEQKPNQHHKFRVRLVTRVTERGSFQNCYVASPRNGRAAPSTKSQARELADRFMGKSSSSKDVIPF